MKKTRLIRALAALFVVLFASGDALAVVGRPLTPVSVAGVARRTSRRTTRRAYYMEAPESFGTVGASDPAASP